MFTQLTPAEQVGHSLQFAEIRRCALERLKAGVYPPLPLEQDIFLTQLEQQVLNERLATARNLIHATPVENRDLSLGKIYNYIIPKNHPLNDDQKRLLNKTVECLGVPDHDPLGIRERLARCITMNARLLNLGGIDQLKKLLPKDFFRESQTIHAIVDGLRFTLIQRPPSWDENPLDIFREEPFKALGASLTLHPEIQIYGFFHLRTLVICEMPDLSATLERARGLHIPAALSHPSFQASVRSSFDNHLRLALENLTRGIALPNHHPQFFDPLHIAALHELGAIMKWGSASSAINQDLNQKYLESHSRHIEAIMNSTLGSGVPPRLVTNFEDFLGALNLLTSQAYLESPEFIASAKRGLYGILSRGEGSIGSTHISNLLKLLPEHERSSLLEEPKLLALAEERYAQIGVKHSQKIAAVSRHFANTIVEPNRFAALAEEIVSAGTFEAKEIAELIIRGRLPLSPLPEVPNILKSDFDALVNKEYDCVAMRERILKNLPRLYNLGGVRSKEFLAALDALEKLEIHRSGRFSPNAHSVLEIADRNSFMPFATKVPDSSSQDLADLGVKLCSRSFWLATGGVLDRAKLFSESDSLLWHSDRKETYAARE